jgi:hypothetical protein
MKDAKPAKTPMGTDGHVDLNKGGKSIDQKAYRSMIGSLLYLCASRPDIMLSVCERELGLHLIPKIILVVELPNTNNWTN